MEANRLSNTVWACSKCERKYSWKHDADNCCTDKPDKYKSFAKLPQGVHQNLRGLKEFGTRVEIKEEIHTGYIICIIKGTEHRYDDFSALCQYLGGYKDALYHNSLTKGKIK